MPSILIRHLSGGRSDQVDSFPSDSYEELVAGRDPLAKIRFDAREADLVSRQHAKIVRDIENPTAFRLIDLQSRNGTFVNQRRVYGSTYLNHNDRIQLGPSGPEFSFELDPPPLTVNGTGSPTATEVSLIPPTREILPYSGTREVGLTRAVGRATVERMLDETFGLLKEESNKAFIVGLLCLVAVVLIGFGTWMYLRRTSAEIQTAQQQNQSTVDSVLKESEKQTAAAKQLNNQVAGLAEKVQQSDAQREAEARSVNARISELKRSQDAAIAAQRRQAVPAASSAQTGPSTLSYGQLLDQVSGLAKQDKYSESLPLAQNMIRIDPNRWEGYFYAGVSALQQQQVREATDYLQQAENRAPSDQRSIIEDLLGTARRISAREK